MRLPWLFAREEYLRFFNGQYLTYPICRFPHVESLHLEPLSAWWSRKMTPRSIPTADDDMVKTACAIDAGFTRHNRTVL
jgi:hypothetical protein